MSVAIPSFGPSVMNPFGRQVDQQYNQEQDQEQSQPSLHQYSAALAHAQASHHLQRQPLRSDLPVAIDSSYGHIQRSAHGEPSFVNQAHSGLPAAGGREGDRDGHASSRTMHQYPGNGEHVAVHALQQDRLLEQQGSADHGSSTLSLNTQLAASSRRHPNFFPLRFPTQSLPGSAEAVNGPMSMSFTDFDVGVSPTTTLPHQSFSSAVSGVPFVSPAPRDIPRISDPLGAGPSRGHLQQYGQVGGYSAHSTDDQGSLASLAPSSAYTSAGHSPASYVHSGYSLSTGHSPVMSHSQSLNEPMQTAGMDSWSMRSAHGVSVGSQGLSWPPPMQPMPDALSASAPVQQSHGSYNASHSLDYQESDNKLHPHMPRYTSSPSGFGGDDALSRSASVGWDQATASKRSYPPLTVWGASEFQGDPSTLRSGDGVHSGAGGISNSAHLYNRGPYPDDNVRWEAVVNRSHQADRHFVYGAVGTLIYCRPSCASKRPTRDKVQFFPQPHAAASAEAAGFRSCKRCRPDRTGGDQTVTAVGDCVRHMMLAAASSAQEGGEPKKRTLKDYAARAGLSTFHFHRSLAKLMSITPGEFAKACQSLALQDALGMDNAAPDRLHVTPKVFDDALTGWSHRRAKRALGNVDPTSYSMGDLGINVTRTSVADSAYGPVSVVYTTGPQGALTIPQIHPAAGGVQDHASAAASVADRVILGLLVGPDAEARLARRFPLALIGDLRAEQEIRTIIRDLQRTALREDQLPPETVPSIRRARLWAAIRKRLTGGTANADGSGEEE
ncbi:unnamed protein product [Parajaminaea phylloscopi]